MVAVESQFPGLPLHQFYFARSRSVPPTSDVRLTIGLLDLKSTQDLNAWEYVEPEILPFSNKESEFIEFIKEPNGSQHLPVRLRYESPERRVPERLPYAASLGGTVYKDPAQY
jgi:hypothetical protein